MGLSHVQDMCSDQQAFLAMPIGIPGSGGARYAAAMYFYQRGMMSAALLEVYRWCSKFDDEDPVAIARFEGVPLSGLSPHNDKAPPP